MARIVRTQQGQFVAIKSDGTRVPINPSKVEQAETLREPERKDPFAHIPDAMAGRPLMDAAQPPPATEEPMIVRNVQGVGAGERSLVKNWAANPEVAKRQLEEFGYDVKPWGKNPLKMQFAVRPRGKNGVWKVLDPDGFDWQDMLDLGGDILSGGIQALTMIGAAPPAAVTGPGALAVEAGASAVGSAAGEAARQGVGTLMGISDNMSASGVATAGVVGGAVPVATKLASPVLRPVGNALAYGFERFGTGLRYAAARVGGVRDLPAMPLKRAVDIVNNAVGRKVVPIAEQAQALHRIMMDRQGGLLNETWPEVAQVNANLLAAKEAGAAMDFRPVLDNIERVAGSAEAGMVERRVAETRPPGDAFDALFKEVRENPEFRPDPEAARTQPMLRKTVQDRDAAMGAEPLPDRRVGGRRKFSELSPERQKAEMDKAGVVERRAAEERRKDVGSAVYDFMHPKMGADMAAGATQPMAKPLPAAPGAPGPVPRDLAEPIQSDAAQKQATSLLNFLVGKIQKSGQRIDAVPLDLAHQLKRYVQDIAKKGGAYDGVAVEEPFARLGRDAAMQIRQGILDNMPSEVADDFANAMAGFERKAKLRRAIINSFQTPGDVEDFLRAVHGRSNAAAALHLAGLEAEFGVSLMPELELARASEMMAKGGPGEIIKRHPIAAGAALFHPGIGLGALAGVAGAPAIAKGAVMAGRATRGLTDLASRGLAAAGKNEAVNAAGVRLLQAAAAEKGKGIASESQASQAARRTKRYTKLF